MKSTVSKLFNKFLSPDKQTLSSKEIQTICDKNQADLILTTGGTGFSPRDCTPEATLSISEKLIPGIPEAMRFYWFNITKRAILSRGVAVIRKQTLIVLNRLSVCPARSV